MRPLNRKDYPREERKESWSKGRGRRRRQKRGGGKKKKVGVSTEMQKKVSSFLPVFVRMGARGGGGGGDG